MSPPHARIKPGPTQIQADILPIAPLAPQLKELSSHYSTYLYTYSAVTKHTIVHGYKHACTQEGRQKLKQERRVR